MYHRISKPLSLETISQMGEKVKVLSTSNFQRIYADGHAYMVCPEQIEGLVSCRNAVKRDAENFISNNSFFKKSRANYYAFHPDFYKTGFFRDYVQIDLTAAYWNIAKNLGYISIETFDTYKDKKAIRNVALGSLASQTREEIFLKGDLVSERTITKETRPLFFNIASECFKIMGNALSIAKVEGCFFVWVDAIFCEKKYAKEVQDSINALGFNSTCEKIDTISSLNKKLTIFMSCGKIKTFHLPHVSKNNFDKLYFDKKYRNG